MLGGAGLAAGVTVGALLADQMLGSAGLAGLPTALFTLGSALTAYLVGRVSQRRGRRVGLGAGFVAGGVGAAGVVVAAALDTVPLLLVALFVYGAGTATNLQARYAGTDLARPHERGKAISVALVSTTLGAVAGPNLVSPLGDLAEGLGLPALAGPFLLACVAYVAAGVAVLVLMRPDPLLLARQLESRAATDATTADAGAVTAPVGRGAVVGGATMVLTQLAMVAVMTMTPVHMRAHDHDLSAVGLVIGLHIAAMYLPSPVTGMLVDRVGRVPVAAGAAVVLLGAGVTAAVAPADSLPVLVLALVLLGLGWNLGLVSGTALVVDSTTPAQRSRVQGNLDVLVALSGASAGVMSGVVVATTSYPALGVGSGLLAVCLVPVLLWWRLERPRTQSR
ncbi:MFS transporter [Janibacter melonis]|uniref:MFS transporter n=1 Tax=Janibacter melonis TaxID=262209 RepID=UPI0020438ABB|nr:MFS transporter [Janibacter melonis]MCM3556232.1 MFS transporter [Janibacter melonis]